MNIERAIELIAMLADGVNPLTGEVLPEEDSCNQVEIVRALNSLLRNASQTEKKKIPPRPENAGKPWTTEDDEKLCTMFDRNSSERELTKCFGRSREAIAARLVRLGKIENRETFRRTYRR